MFEKSPKRQKGYACVGLHSPKNELNVGSAMRACEVYGAKLLVSSGRRYRCGATDPSKHNLNMPHISGVDDLFHHLPYNCVPVAVDILDDATPLPEYIHPERAFYIFGPEDSTLGSKIIDRCQDKVYVPAPGHCMNLAATVNVVLYDRMFKNGWITK